MAAAAGGQASVLLSFQRGRNRAEAKEENEKDGKSTPHLGIIVHDEQGLRNSSDTRSDACLSLNGGFIVERGDLSLNGSL